MRYLGAWQLCLPVLTMLLCVAASGDDSQQAKVGNRVTLRNQFIAETDAIKKGRLAHLLVDGMTSREINELCSDEHPGVALVAAWQRILIQVSARLQGEDRGAAVLPIPKELIREFTGFVEGRLRVPLPDAWLRCVTSQTCSNAGIIRIPTQLYGPHIADDLSEKIFTGRQSFPKIALNSKERPLLIGVIGGRSFAGNDGTIAIPQEISPEFDEVEKIHLSAICGEDRGFVVRRDVASLEGKIHCISTLRPLGGEPKIYWTASIDSTWSRELKGATVWFTELRMRDDRVFLFHCSDLSFGVECFSTKDGKRNRSQPVMTNCSSQAGRNLPEL